MPTEMRGRACANHFGANVVSWYAENVGDDLANQRNRYFGNREDKSLEATATQGFLEKPDCRRACPPLEATLVQGGAPFVTGDPK